MIKSDIEIDAINEIGKTCPLLLAKLCNETFLPPTQLIYALQALEWYPDKNQLHLLISNTLEHFSDSVVNQALITLGFGSLEE